MVRVPCLGQDGYPFDMAFQWMRRQNIIDAPAQVLGARVGTETPPGIIMWLFIMVAKRIDKTGVDKILHPVPFRRQKAGRVGV